MTWPEAALLVLAGLAGGTTNALAGGATFFTFPAMLAVGLPPIVANASNAVALWPASLIAALAQLREIAGARRLLPALVLTGLAGGAAGALLLLRTTDAAFLRLVPFLLLGATLLFALSPRLLPLLRKRGTPGRVRFGPGKLGLMALCAVYGGYFGAGIGIMMMAGLTLAGIDDVRVANALKNLLSGFINGVAVAIFVASDVVDWPGALVMLAGAVAGGALGGRLAGAIPARALRLAVISVGSFLTAWYFWRAWA